MNDVWVTVDITSLYTVIPHDMALLALNWFLDTFSNYSRVLKNYLILVAKYLLQHKSFFFQW